MGWRRRRFGPASTLPIPLIDIDVLDPNLDPKFARSKPQIIYWIGRVTYNDIFGNTLHTTKFCLWYVGRDLEQCPGGNSMD
jgi:hypothetical protein